MKEENKKQDFVRWMHDVNIYPPMLTVSYDMGWQQRSSGHKYDSTTGHSVMIGAHSKKVIGRRLKCKACPVCALGAKSKIPTPTHICTKNRHKPSKSMEVDAIYNLLVHLWDSKQVGVGSNHVCAPEALLEGKNSKQKDEWRWVGASIRRMKERR